jgi:hypothetical protein
VNGQYRYNIARLKPDGKLDTPFNPGANSQVNSIAVQSDGNILVGGYFSTIDGQERHCIARLKGEVPMFSAQEYLPLEPGTIWKYIRNGKSTVTRRVFNEEIIVNGVKTRPVKYVEENVTEYLTNGKNGINLHRQYQPNVYVGGVGWVDVDVTFVPPIKLADSEVWIGQKIRSIGTTQMVLWPSGKTYYFGYWAETTIEAEEQVTVPAGTFNAVRYKESIEVYDQYMETTRYLAKGIGIVKDITLNPGGARSTYELKSMTLLNLLAPDGGESIPSGGTYDIIWQASLDMTTFQLKYSIDDGATWLPIKGAEHVTDNHYLWTVPMPVNNKTSCRVKVKGYDSSNVLLETDVSEKPFTIEVVRVTSPNGGEVWSSGELRPITWLTNETIRPVAEIQLYYTKNNGITWLPITTITGSNPGTYDWIVPPITKVKKNCKVKLKLKDSAGNSIGSDVSDQVFTVQPLP